MAGCRRRSNCVRAIAVGLIGIVVFALVAPISVVNTLAAEFSLPTCEATSEFVPEFGAITGRVVASSGPIESARVHLEALGFISCVITNTDGVFVLHLPAGSGEVWVTVDPPVITEGLAASSRTLSVEESTVTMNLGDFNLDSDDAIRVEAVSPEGVKWIKACLLDFVSNALQCSAIVVTSETSHEFLISRPGPVGEDQSLYAIGVIVLPDGSREVRVGDPFLINFTESPEFVEPPADGCAEDSVPDVAGAVTSGGLPYANATVAAFISEHVAGPWYQSVEPWRTAQTDSDGKFQMCFGMPWGDDDTIWLVRFVAYSHEMGVDAEIGDTASEIFSLTFISELDDGEGDLFCEDCKEVDIAMVAPTIRGQVPNALFGGVAKAQCRALDDSGSLPCSSPVWGLRTNESGEFSAAFPFVDGLDYRIFLSPTPFRWSNHGRNNIDDFISSEIPTVAPLMVLLTDLDGSIRTLDATLPDANFRLGFVDPTGERILDGYSTRAEIVDGRAQPVPAHNLVVGLAALLSDGSYTIRAREVRPYPEPERLSNASFSVADGQVTPTTPNLSFSDGVWWMQLGEDAPVVEPPPQGDPVTAPPGGGVPAGGGSSSPSADPVTIAVPRPESSTTPVSLGFSVPTGRLELTLTGLTASAEATVAVIEPPEASGVTLLPTAFDIDVAMSGRLGQAELCVPIDSAEVATAGVDPERLSIYHFTPGPVDITSRVTSTQVCGVTTSFSPFALGVPASSRIAGATRYDTAARLVALAFPDTADLVLVATGANFPDALAASAAAAKADAPLLLVSPTAIPSATRTQLTRMQPKRIVIVGGTAAVGSSVERDLARFGTVERVAGANRFETAARLATRFFDTTTTDAYLVSGENFPDALAAGAASSYTARPVLLTGANTLPAATSDVLRSLTISRVTIVGGERAVSSNVALQTGALVAQVLRIAGQDRYDTAARLADTLADPGRKILLATGTNFPDALGAAAMAARLDASLLLTAPMSASQPTSGYLGRRSPTAITVLGGYNAIARKTESQFATSYLP